MYCESCGHQLNADARFCPKCGQRASRPTTRPLQSVTAVSPAPAAPNAPPSTDMGQFRPMRVGELLFSITGRIGRVWFLVCYLSLTIASLAFFVAVAFTFRHARTDNVVSLTTLLFIWPSISIWVKRFHDFDYSGVWLLVGFIPIIGLAVVIGAFVISGTKGSNKYGQAPNILPVVKAEPELSNWPE